MPKLGFSWPVQGPSRSSPIKCAVTWKTRVLQMANSGQKWTEIPEAVAEEIKQYLLQEGESG